MSWKKLSTETVVDNRWIKVERAGFGSDSGRLLEDYWLVEKAEYALTVGEAEDGVILVREFRPGSGRMSLSFPGGQIAPGEAPVDAACREFTEETGWLASEARLLGRLDPQAGWLKCTCHVFHVRASAPPAALPVDADVEEVVRLSWPELREQVRAGEVNEMHAVAAFYLAADLLGKL